TRLQGDWSSDVCSSDLTTREPPPRYSARYMGCSRPSLLIATGPVGRNSIVPRPSMESHRPLVIPPISSEAIFASSGGSPAGAGQIGRASCRERGEGSEG